jgi:hypothetical protein
MAAGLGFKDFTTGEVLTAADVDGYLMQGIWVFASNAARDAAVTAPAEGNFAFTKDTNSLWYYDGAAWVASGATGDIEGVTAGVGISGGGTSGTVTVTNSMATAIDAKGDLIVGTGADTFSRLAVGGTNGHTLQVDSSTATGLAWAAPAGGASFVGCSLYKTAVQSIANDTNTIINWDAEYFDTDAFHDNSSNTSRITIPSGKGGKYLITGQISFAADSDEQRIARIYKNGASAGILTAQRASIAPDSTAASFAWLINLVATDYIELSVYQNGGGSLDFKTDGQFNAIYLGA